LLYRALRLIPIFIKQIGTEGGLGLAEMLQRRGQPTYDLN
jgi:hypothetical protein